MTEKCIALLGRKDKPTDGVEEYCQYLAEALREHGFDLEIVRCSWEEVGWAATLEELRRQASEWRGAWVLVQYTAQGWSQRGFPLRFPGVLNVLRRAGARIGIVFHEAEAHAGRRWVDMLRRHVQLRVLRHGLERAELAVLTIPAEKISWIRKAPAKAVFIPVGANLPSPEKVWGKNPDDANRVPTIAVFGISGGNGGDWEMSIISEAVQFVAERLGKVRLMVVGRNSEAAEKVPRLVSEKGSMEMVVMGIVPAEKLAETLAEADVLLFVRGTISTRRGSAIAGIACGLPVVAFEGADTAWPITEAGVVLANMKQKNSAGEALLRVLKDGAYRAELAERSRRAQEQHFSWSAIGEKYAQALRRSR